MHALAERLLKTIRKRELIRPGDRVAAAVSGGADSVALLVLLLELRAELGIVLSIAHVNHKLRGQESDEDEQFVAALARRHQLELHSEQAPLGGAVKAGIEAAARKLRYDFFRRLALEKRVSKIATAHTLDDQAETVLLRILRGTGIRGLAGVQPRLIFAEGGRSFGEVVRPLLGLRRAEVEVFLGERGQTWRDDSSNRDPAFLRNRVRHEVLPLLAEKFGPAAENLADLAEIARGEEEHWKQSHPEIRPSADSVVITSLLALPLAVQRRLTREWLESKPSNLGASFRLIEEVLDLAHGPAGKRLELPGGRIILRTQRDLCLESSDSHLATADYEYRLTIPGQAEIPELGMQLEAVMADLKSIPETERQQLLDATRLPKELVVRNWRAGDRFWPAHTKEAKKVKELLNDRHIAGPEKRLWPVVVAEELGLVWMRAFPTPASVQPAPGASRVLWIRAIANSELAPRGGAPAL